eukprot:g5987.t1
MQSNRPYNHSTNMAQAAAGKSGKQVALAFVVRFKTQGERNAFYAASGKEGQAAEKCAHAMLRALGLAGGAAAADAETADAFWVLPRAKAPKAGRARLAVQPGAARAKAGVKAEAEQGTGPGTEAKGGQSNGSSSRHDAMDPTPPGEPPAAVRQHLAARNGLAGGSEALALCLRLHAEVCSSRSKEAAEWQARLRAGGGELVDKAVEELPAYRHALAALQAGGQAAGSAGAVACCC